MFWTRINKKNQAKTNKINKRENGESWGLNHETEKFGNKTKEQRKDQKDSNEMRHQLNSKEKGRGEKRADRVEVQT